MQFYQNAGEDFTYRQKCLTTRFHAIISNYLYNLPAFAFSVIQAISYYYFKFMESVIDLFTADVNQSM